MSLTLEPLPIGRVVDRYTIQQELGQGSMAVVYRVQHNELNTMHALKVLYLPTQGLQRRALQEGRIQAKLRHPNIVSVTDVIRIQGVPALVMDYVHGPALDSLLDGHRFSLAQADRIAQDILAGVSAAHVQGLVHRDLKPANVIITVVDDRVVPRVTDFGVAKILNEATEGAGNLSTRTGMAMGTPAYMAPEQFRNAKGVDQRADVFSLGAILYQLVTGKLPFNGADMIDCFISVSAEAYEPIAESVPGVPTRMVRAISGALKADVDERIPTCAELLKVWRGEESGGVYMSIAPEEEVWSSADLDVIRSLVPHQMPEVERLGSSTTFLVDPMPYSPTLESDPENGVHYYADAVPRPVDTAHRGPPPPGVTLAPRESQSTGSYISAPLPDPEASLVEEAPIPDPAPEREPVPAAQASMSQHRTKLDVAPIVDEEIVWKPANTGRRVAVAALLLGAVALAGFGFWSSREEPVDPVATAQPKPTPPAVEAAEPQELASKPEDPVDEPVAETPAVTTPTVSERSTRPVRSSTPKPAARPTVSKPEPATEPAIEPEGSDAVALVDEEPEPAPVRVTATTKPNVTVSGVERSYLVDSRGSHHQPGVVAPGTYTLHVYFDDSESKSTPVMTLDIQSGAVYNLNCVPSARKCR